MFGPFKAALKREIESIFDLGIRKLTFPSCVVQQWIRATNFTAAFAAAGISPIRGIDAIPTTMFQPNTGVRAQAGQIGCQIGAHQDKAVVRGGGLGGLNPPPKNFGPAYYL